MHECYQVLPFFCDDARTNILSPQHFVYDGTGFNTELSDATGCSSCVYRCLEVLVIYLRVHPQKSTLKYNGTGNLLFILGIFPEVSLAQAFDVEAKTFFVVPPVTSSTHVSRPLRISVLKMLNSFSQNDLFRHS